RCRAFDLESQAIERLRERGAMAEHALEQLEVGPHELGRRAVALARSVQLVPRLAQLQQPEQRVGGAPRLRGAAGQRLQLFLAPAGALGRAGAARQRRTY